ncbi:hypothetical protein ACFWJT_15985 [Streptomyces sp. NPDC127069]|uniref:hypothetical protein n=1 Tax=Streptomyces sp. NPDC127069 TaxID=3347128 RepID=UPI0036697F32
MRTTRRTAPATLSAVLLLLAGCGQSYDDLVNQCHEAVVKRANDNKSKPAACSQIKQDDYDLIVMSTVIDGLGWTKDGKFDKNKMLEGSGAGH